MAKIVHLIILSFIILLAQSAAAADFTHNINVKGATRSFIVHVPDSLKDKKNLPLVIVMHGGGGEAEGIRRQTGMDAVADRNGFIVVYPEGTGGPAFKNMRTWNAGLCCGTAVRDKVDDVSFISAMIDFLVQNYAVDKTRVYATGHSNGAMMSYRLACELSGKIAAIAPNSGQRVLADCHPKRPVAVLHIHGTADPCALYECGKKCGGCFGKLLGFDLPGDTWPCASVRDVASQTAAMNGCRTVTDIVFTKGKVTCESFEGCPASAPVELCSIEGAGHVWAGSKGGENPVCYDHPERRICTRHEEVVGPANNDIDASQFMWDFFKNIRIEGAAR